MVSEMEVIWSAKARITFYKVLDYLENNWNRREIVKFNKRTEVILQAIKRNPGIFPLSQKQMKIRKAIVDKNNSLFYKVDERNERIYLLTFFDNRQNPENLKINNLL